MGDMQKAILSMEGLSIGDAFGTALGEGKTSSTASQMISGRQLPPPPWEWTDDTHMALSIVEILSEFGIIEQDALADRFVKRFMDDPYRGYGSGAIRLLKQIGEGGYWKDLSPKLFGEGSYGNGAAMRAAPIGGYYHGQAERTAAEAQKSAVITHAHPEGQAGAMAVAVAAAIVAQPEMQNKDIFLSEVTKYVPEGETRESIQLALQIPEDNLKMAVERLGTGWNVSAQDTVPFCLWCVANNFDDFETALWTTAAGAGDRDTTCAIVGGIMALSVGKVPQEWIKRREELPDLAISNTTKS